MREKETAHGVDRKPKTVVGKVAAAVITIIAVAVVGVLRGIGIGLAMLIVLTPLMLPCWLISGVAVDHLFELIVTSRYYWIVMYILGCGLAYHEWRDGPWDPLVTKNAYMEV